MPYCACYHDHTRDPDGFGTPLHPEDAGGILPGALGMRDGRAPVELLALLQDRLVVGLGPTVDECYALGPYSVHVGDGVWGHAEFGEAVHRAKYAKDQSARVMLSRELTQFAKSHPRMRSVAAVAAPPKFDPEEPNIPLAWARSVAEALGTSIATARKTRPTSPQKDLEGLEYEGEVVARVRDSVQVNGMIWGDALVIDDTVRSGGMVREMGRALKAAGADKVYALCVAKDAKFTSGGLNLFRERWL